MKTTDCLLTAAFVFCVATAAQTGGTLTILAAGTLAALLIAGAERTCPVCGYLPGSRRTAVIERDIMHVRRQIRLWWVFMATPVTAALVVLTVLYAAMLGAHGFPGNWVRVNPFGLQREGIVLGIVVGALLFYDIVIVVGCIYPLQAALGVFYNESAMSANAERNTAAVAGRGDWHSCNQADWDDPAARERLRRQRNERLFGTE